MRLPFDPFDGTRHPALAPLVDALTDGGRSIEDGGSRWIVIGRPDGTFLAAWVDAEDRLQASVHGDRLKAWDEAFGSWSR